MTRAERVALHTNQKRMQLSGNMPNEKSLVEGKPQYRETFKGLYQYVKYNNEVYSQLLTKDTRTLQEEINDTVNNITVNEITISGTLDVSSGGTGLATIADGAVMLGSGTSAVTPLAVTTNGAILIGDGTTDPTTYNAFSSSTGTLNVGAGGTGQTTVTDFKNVLDDETWTFANNVTATGRAIVDDTTEATSTTDGSLQTDGGLSVVKSVVIGDDLDLLSDSCIINVGSTSKFTLTDQSSNNCLMATADHRLAFGDAGEYIYGDGTDMKIISSGDVDMTATLFDVTGAITASGIIKTDDTTEATSTTDGSLQTDGGLSVVKSAVIGDDLDLLSNSAIFKVGSDQPFTLTHANANNTLTATANHRLAFGDAGEYISGAGSDITITSSALIKSDSPKFHFRTPYEFSSVTDAYYIRAQTDGQMMTFGEDDLQANFSLISVHELMSGHFDSSFDDTNGAGWA